MNADPRKHFNELTHEQACAAVREMAAHGATDIGIAMATGWSVEYVAHVIGQRQERRA